MTSAQDGPVRPCGNPPLIPSLPHLLLYLLVFLTFSPFLLASSVFLLFHLFPFYGNSPTPFPGLNCCRRRLNLALVFMCVDFVLYVFFS